MDKTINTIIGAVIVACLVFFAYHYFNSNDNKEKKLVSAKDSVNIDSILTRHNFDEDSLKAKLRAKPKIITTVKKDTVKESVNVDSLWEEAKSYWKDKLSDSLNRYDYVSSIDTSYNDSLVTLDVAMVSPMPIHPESYFILDLEVLETEVQTDSIKTLEYIEEVPFYKNEWFWVAVGEGLVILAIVYKAISGLL